MKPLSRPGKRIAALSFAAAIALASATTAATSAEETSQVNLYSYRQPFLMAPILSAFTDKTGIKVNVVYARKGVLERLKAEGVNSPADMVLTADVGRLNDMVEAGIVQPVHSPVLDSNIPANLRHPDGLWYGLTMRARLILASRDRVRPGEITTYQDLAEPRFRGRVCTRSGKHVYMISLLAAMIAHHGEDKAEAWLRGLKANLARRPQGNDRAQVKAIYEGLCDVTLANSYYMGKMATNERQPEQKRWARAVRVVFPDQQGNGTHVNISGAAVTRSAKHREQALRLLEYLSSDEAQRLYAEQNFEYPVRPGVPLAPLVAAWGPFKADDLSLAVVARYRAAASRLVDRVGYDQGAGS